ncbi:MAG TPA: ABC transporter ATP-binding protein [Anaerolineales bacterium]|nr:ABC transporter ATP-binding protein [Anaerolineales bacterium]
MIQLMQVTYSYPVTSRPALREITLEIPTGQFCALVGANGAGKSTLAYTIAGFIPHFYHGNLAGSVLIDGKETSQVPLSQLVQQVGLIFQNPFNQISGTKFTVREEIAFGLENLGLPRDEMEARIQATLSLVGIEDLAERYPLALSGGQMQRVAIASVLAMRPQVLVLDEPTSQLDPVGSREVFAAVRALIVEGGITVVMIEHKLEWVAVFADRVIALVDGALAADGDPQEVLTDETLVGKTIGQTRYTRAARQAQRSGYWPQDRQLPVTLEQAVDGFRESRGTPAG